MALRRRRIYVISLDALAEHLRLPGTPIRAVFNERTEVVEFLQYDESFEGVLELCEPVRYEIKLP